MQAGETSVQLQMLKNYAKQTNLKRAQAALDLLYKISEERKIDIAKEDYHSQLMTRRGA